MNTIFSDHAFLHLTARHPGVATLAASNSNVARDLSTAEKHNQAAAVLVRDNQPLDGYDPTAKQKETFQHSYKVKDNLRYWDLDQRHWGFLHNNTSEDKQFDSSINRSRQDREYLNTQPEVRDALRKNLSTDREIRDPDLPDVGKVRSALAESARLNADDTTPITGEYLQDNEHLALWLAEGRAGINEEMKAHGDTITSKSATDTWDLLKGRIADEAMSWFPENTHMEREFFEQYPDAALHLKQNPRLLTDLQRHNDRARDFQSEFAGTHERITPELVASAAAFANSPGMFNERWFTERPDIAVLSESAREVLGDTSLTDIFSLSDLRKDYSQRGLGQDVEMSLSGAALTDAGIPNDFAASQTWLPRLANRSEEFRSSLISDRETLTSELPLSAADRLDPEKMAIRLAQGVDPELPLTDKHENQGMRKYMRIIRSGNGEDYAELSETANKDGSENGAQAHSRGVNMYRKQSLMAHKTEHRPGLILRSTIIDVELDEEMKQLKDKGGQDASENR